MKKIRFNGNRWKNLRHFAETLLPIWKKISSNAKQSGSRSGSMLCESSFWKSCIKKYKTLCGLKNYLRRSLKISEGSGIYRSILLKQAGLKFLIPLPNFWNKMNRCRNLPPFSAGKAAHKRCLKKSCGIKSS